MPGFSLSNLIVPLCHCFVRIIPTGAYLLMFTLDSSDKNISGWLLLVTMKFDNIGSCLTTNILKDTIEILIEVRSRFNSLCTYFLFFYFFFKNTKVSVALVLQKYKSTSLWWITCVCSKALELDICAFAKKICVTALFIARQMFSSPYYQHSWFSQYRFKQIEWVT